MDSSHTLGVISKDLRQIFHTKNPSESFCKAHQFRAGGKCYVCMQPGVYSYVLSLPRELFLFYQCLISLSEVTVVVGGGLEYWGTLRAYCSVSKLLGLGREGVVCGFAFNVLFTKVIVLFCIVV